MSGEPSTNKKAGKQPVAEELRRQPRYWLALDNDHDLTVAEKVIVNNLECASSLACGQNVMIDMMVKLRIEVDKLAKLMQDDDRQATKGAVEDPPKDTSQE